MAPAHSTPRGFAFNRAVWPRWGGLALICALGACSGGDDDDDEPFAVLVQSPAPDATAVAPTSVVEATFSRQLAPASVTPATFLVFSGGVPLAGTVDSTGSVATFTPAVPLPGASTFTARVTTGVTDTAGNPLPSEVQWSFSTPFPAFAYVANSLEGTVSIYSVDPATGQLQALNSVAAQLAPRSLALDPAGRFVHVGNGLSNSITGFRIGTDGGLTRIEDFPAGQNPSSLAVVQGRVLYAANQGEGTVSIFGIDQASGALFTAATPVLVGPMPSALAIDPSIRFLYVAGSGSVTPFFINQLTGGLTAAESPLPAGTGSGFVAVEPTGRFALVASSGSNDVRSFEIDPGTGALELVGAPVPAGLAPRAIAADPSGRFVYVANSGSNDVTAFRIDPATGVLVEVGAEVGAGSAPSSIAVDPSGRFVYVTNLASNNSTTFAVNPLTGALSAVGGATATGIGPGSIAILRALD
jgi:6-phosphogluconolactonase